MSNFSEHTKNYYQDYLKRKYNIVRTEEEIESDLEAYADLFSLFVGMASRDRSSD